MRHLLLMDAGMFLLLQGRNLSRLYCVGGEVFLWSVRVTTRCEMALLV